MGTFNDRFGKVSVDAYAGASDDVKAQAAMDDNDYGTVCFGTRTYTFQQRVEVPQGKALEFNGSVITAGASMPTSGTDGDGVANSALFYFDGTEPTSRRGNGMNGHATFTTGGRASRGIVVGHSPGKSRFGAYMNLLVFGTGFDRAVEMVLGGWYVFALRGMFVNSTADNGIAFDLQDLDGTTMYLEQLTVGLTGGSGKQGFRLEAETIQMNGCSCDQASAGTPAIELMGNNIGTQVEAVNLHLEGNSGPLIKINPHTNSAFKWRGGLFHAPSDNTSTAMFDVGADTNMFVDHVRHRAFTNWSNYATVGSGAVLGVAHDFRDFSADAPWNSFTGSGEAYQIYKGKRINLHNSP